MSNSRRLAVGAILSAAFVWCYWDVFAVLVQRWSQIPDYSHGFFVIPLAAFVAYSRRESLPREWKPSFVGLAVVLAGTAMRVAGTMLTIEPVEQLSLLVTLAGLIWTAGGWGLLRWSAPALGLLVFMIPFPYSIAVARASQLQRIAAVSSGYLLGVLGMPAFAEGNVIQTVSGALDVAYACSGLQMMVAFLAVTYAFAVLSKYPLSGKIAIFLSAVPIAVVCNILRVTATGVAYQYYDGEQVRRFFHDFGGLILIPIAIGMVFLAISLFERSFPKRLENG